MLKVLIVEDDYLQASDLGDLLESHGYNVCGLAKSGGPAVSMVEARRPDIVLMDVGLAEPPDGLDLAKMIVAIHPCLVVFVTGCNADELRPRLGILSAAPILSKPVEQGLILKTLRRAARRSPVTVSAENSVH